MKKLKIIFFIASFIWMGVYSVQAFDTVSSPTCEQKHTCYQNQTYGSGQIIWGGATMYIDGVGIANEYYHYYGTYGPFNPKYVYEDENYAIIFADNRGAGHQLNCGAQSEYNGGFAYFIVKKSDKTTKMLYNSSCGANYSAPAPWYDINTYYWVMNGELIQETFNGGVNREEINTTKNFLGNFAYPPGYKYPDLSSSFPSQGVMGDKTGIFYKDFEGKANFWGYDGGGAGYYYNGLYDAQQLTPLGPLVTGIGANSYLFGNVNPSYGSILNNINSLGDETSVLIETGSTFTHLNYFNNPYAYFSDSANNIKKWSVACINPGFTNCTAFDNVYFCSNESNNKDPQNITCDSAITPPSEGGGGEGGETGTGYNQIPGGDGHSIDTGNTITFSGQTCKEVLYETGFTYTPITTFLSGDIFTEDPTPNQHTIGTDNELIDFGAYSTGVTVFDNDSWIYGHTGATLLRNVPKNRLRIEVRMLQPFNYFKLIPNSTGISNEVGLDVGGIYDIKGKEEYYSDGLFYQKYGPYRFRNYLDGVKPYGLTMDMNDLVSGALQTLSVKSFEIGNYTSSYASQYNCSDQYSECNWQLMMDGTYVCPTERNICYVDGNKCVRNPDVKVIQGPPGTIPQVAGVNDYTDDIFSCPEYQSWLDAPACLKTIVKNFVNLFKKSVDSTGDNGAVKIVGQVKNIGTVSETGSVNFGAVSETGANLADVMVRKTWNQSFNGTGPINQWGKFAFYGVMLLLAIVIIGLTIVVLHKKKT